MAIIMTRRHHGSQSQQRENGGAAGCLLVKKSVITVHAGLNPAFFSSRRLGTGILPVDSLDLWLEPPAT
jgi:hypothetical protein